MSNSLYNLFRKIFVIGWVTAFLIITGITCHHSSKYGGEFIPFEYSEAELHGRYLGGGISAGPEDMGSGPEFTTYFTTLNTDGLGAFSTIEHVTNTNGVITEAQKSGLYTVDIDGNLSLSFDGDMSNADTGLVIRQGEMAFLTALDPGDNPGFQIFFELGESGSYPPEIMDGTFWLYGYGFDLTKYPDNVVARSMELIIDVDSASGQFNWSRNYWNIWNFDLNEPEFVTYDPGDPLDYSFDADGNLTLFDLPNLSELRGAVDSEGRLGFLTTLINGQEPAIFFLARQADSHSAADFSGDYYSLVQAFSFDNALHAATFADLNFDGVNYFAGDYTSNYTLGIEEGTMDGSYTIGVVGYTTMKLITTNRTMVGGCMQTNDFAELITPAPSDSDRSPSLALFIKK